MQKEAGRSAQESSVKAKSVKRLIEKAEREGVIPGHADPETIKSRRWNRAVNRSPVSAQYPVVAKPLFHFRSANAQGHPVEGCGRVTAILGTWS